jgi:rRNA maturation endonuclease Nob1
MKSVRSALRKGEIEKDNYERLSCASCEKNLKTENPADELYSLKFCPECGRKWKQLG